jgi:type I restriction-modification system DNA methylase subunit
MQAVSLANSGDKSKRRELDFYPTPPDATHALMKFLTENKIIQEDSLVWEPACGNGAMSKVIQEYVTDVYSTDLRHTDFGHGGKDFMSSTFDCDAVITNPPFNISEEFIKHSLKQAPVVAMLLKSQYWHAQKRIKLFNETKPAFVLPLTWRPDFLFDQRENGVKGSPTMEVLWTVWVDGITDCKYQLLSK